MEPRGSRFARAHRSLQVAKVAIATAAALGFGAFALAARAAHPGTAQHTTRVRADDNDDATQNDEFDFGGSSIAPSYGAAPSVGSGGS